MKSILLEKITALDESCEYLLEEYIDFCLLNAQPESVPGETEYHHILLKSIWPEYENLSEHPWNGIHLTYEHHYIAHSMLANATDNKSAVYAWWQMNSGNINYKNHDGIALCSSKYAELREKHYNLVSKSQTEKNKDPKLIKKRLNTLSKIGDDGLTGFERTGRKISKALKENGSCAGSNNSQYQRMIVKYRTRPTKKISVKLKDYDNVETIPAQVKYILLYDNTGKLYFEGWKDEAEIYCESIGLDPRKINYNNDIIFVYTGTQNDYLLKLMRLLGLGRYINSKIIILSDEEAENKMMNKKETYPL